MEFNIIKVLDGIFIGNRSVLTDYEFIANNKISHIVIWIDSPIASTYEEQFPISEKEALEIMKMMGIISLLFTEKKQAPEQIATQNCIQMIEQSRDEQLCCLIIAENIFNTMWFIVPYLRHKFGWSIETCVGYLQKKLVSLSIDGTSEILKQIQISIENAKTKVQDLGKSDKESKKFQKAELSNDEDSFIEFLEFNKIETAIELYPDKSRPDNKQGKVIRWNDAEFMKQYKSDNLDEMLLINTIKNMSAQIEPHSAEKQKKSRRIKWFDQKKKAQVPQNQKIFANSLINTCLKKSFNESHNQNSHINIRPLSGKLSLSEFKNAQNNSRSSNRIRPVLKSYDSDKQLVMSRKIQGIQQGNQMNKKASQGIIKEKTEKQLSLFQDSNYQQLKQMSRTNFSDMANFSRRLSCKKKKMQIVKKSKYSSNKYSTPNNKENLLKNQSMQCLGFPATFTENSKLSSNKVGSRKKIKINNLALPPGKKQQNFFGMVKSSPNFFTGLPRDKRSFQNKVLI